MGRHRSRQNATHLLSAERDEQIGEDEYGTPTFDTVDVLDDEPVELDEGGTSFVRESSGERVRRAPKISGRGDLADELEEGDVVTLDPLAPDAPVLSDLEIRRIVRDYGRRSRAGRVTIELEDI